MEHDKHFVCSGPREEARRASCPTFRLGLQVSLKGPSDMLYRSIFCCLPTMRRPRSILRVLMWCR